MNVIMADNDKYWAIDQGSGGYPYWSTFLGTAKFFASFEAAQKVLQTDADMTRILTYSDGSTRPPRMIDSGIGLCNTKHKGKVTISIAKIDFRILTSKVYTGEIKKD